MIREALDRNRGRPFETWCSVMDSRHPAIQPLFPVARAMLSATFILSAVRHLSHWSAALDEMGTLGMPRSSFLLTGSIALRLIGGIAMLLGFYGRAGAALLVAFVLPAAVLGHGFWAVPPERQAHETIEFLNNLSMAGGALLVVLNGAGPWSIDAMKRHGSSSN